MAILTESERQKEADSGIVLLEEEESDVEQDQLDRYLDSMYDQYQDRKSESDAKFRAKKARKEYEDGDWEGFSADNYGSDDDEINDDSSDESSNNEEVPLTKSLLTDLDHDKKISNGLSKRAAHFFDQDIFKDIGGVAGDESEADAEDDAEELTTDLDNLEKIVKNSARAVEVTPELPPSISPSIHFENSDDSDGSDGFEVVKRTSRDAQ
jgi:AdoMet-dependent rRNA methyltransferase SPB1